MKTTEYKQSLLEIAKNNFQIWNEALQTKDAEVVASLYSEDNTFLPTMSGDFKFGKGGAEDYFEHFLLKNPFGIIVKEKVQLLGENSYVHSGLYDFEIESAEKGREVVEARFTFVWQKNKSGQWKIIHHHSSVKPK